MRFILILMILILSGCQTATNALSSQYFSSDKDIIYEYGNFCGPYLPTFLKDYDKKTQKSERLLRMQSLKPVDSIDYGCKIHDICYEKYGHDSPACDRVFLSYITLKPPYYSIPQKRAIPTFQSTSDTKTYGYLKIPTKIRGKEYSHPYTGLDWRFLAINNQRSQLGIAETCNAAVEEISAGFKVKLANLKGAERTIAILGAVLESPFIVTTATLNKILVGYPNLAGNCNYSKDIHAYAIENAALNYAQFHLDKLKSEQRTAHIQKYWYQYKDVERSMKEADRWWDNKVQSCYKREETDLRYRCILSLANSDSSTPKSYDEFRKMFFGVSSYSP